MISPSELSHYRAPFLISSLFKQFAGHFKHNPEPITYANTLGFNRLGVPQHGANSLQALHYKNVTICGSFGVPISDRYPTYGCTICKHYHPLSLAIRGN